MKKILTVSACLLSMILPFFVGNVTLAQQEVDPGISFDKGCLKGMGSDCFDYEEIIGIAEAGTKPTATSIAQDVFYAATYMVGTILTIVIIWCGIGYILASKDGKDVNSYKKGLTSAAIGALLVRGAYTIVRLVQYIAKG